MIKLKHSLSCSIFGCSLECLYVLCCFTLFGPRTHAHNLQAQKCRCLLLYLQQKYYKIWWLFNTGVSSANFKVRFCFMPYFLRTEQTAELTYNALKLKNYWKTLLCSENYPNITIQTYPKTNFAEMSWAPDT